MGQVSSQISPPEGQMEAKNQAGEEGAQERAVNGKEHLAAMESPSGQDHGLDFQRESSQSVDMVHPFLRHISSQDNRGNAQSKMSSHQRIDLEMEKRKLSVLNVNRSGKEKSASTAQHRDPPDPGPQKPLDEGPLSSLNYVGRPLIEEPEDIHVAPSHPLDEISTDDEFEELAKEAELTEVSQNHADRPQRRLFPIANAEERDDSSTSLPSYSTSQRQYARESMLRDGPSIGNRRKRKRRSPKDTEDPDIIPDSTISGAIRPEKRRERSALIRPHLQTPDLSTAPTCSSARDEVEVDSNNLAFDDASGELDLNTSILTDASVFDASSAVDHPRDPQNLHLRDYRNLDSISEVDDKPYRSPYAILDRQRASLTPESASSASAMQLMHGTPTTVAPKGRRKQPRVKQFFGAKEFSMVDGYRTSWCILNDREMSDFNDAIHSNQRSNKMTVGIFKDLVEMFPDHSLQYIIKACRRKFHNFEKRGVWTAEQDERLRQAVAEKGTSWKVISEELGRFWEDCRDRYRNYLLNAEHRNMHSWTDAEVLNLACAVLDCVISAKVAEEGHNLDWDTRDIARDLILNPEHQSDSLLNWQSVSDRMGSAGGARSRMQCSTKWKRFKDEERKILLFRVVQARWPDTTDANEYLEKRPEAFGWRIGATMSKMRNILVGDKFDILEAVLACEAPDENHIPWPSIGDGWLCNRWTPREKRAAWLFMKESAEYAEPRKYRETAQTLLSSLPQDERDERWDPSSYLRGQDQLKKKHAEAEARKRRTVGDSAANPVDLDDYDSEEEHFSLQASVSTPLPGDANTANAHSSQDQDLESDSQGAHIQRNRGEVGRSDANLSVEQQIMSLQNLC